MKMKVLFVLLGLLVLTSCGSPAIRNLEGTGPFFCSRPTTIQFQAVEEGGHESLTSFVLTPPSVCDLPTLYCVSTYRGISCVEIGD